MVNSRFLSKEVAASSVAGNKLRPWVPTHLPRTRTATSGALFLAASEVNAAPQRKLLACPSWLRLENPRRRGSREPFRFLLAHRARLMSFVGVILCALSSLGCAGHAAKTLKARQALDAGRPKEALSLYNKLLKVKSADQLPDKRKKDTPLLVLDRSLVSQQLGNYKASGQDLEYADKQVEILDMSRSAISDIGRYVFSDDAGPYKSPPHEKVMINTMNMVNYLVRHDLNGARIEARRLAIVQKYLRDTNHPAEAANAPGGYLAGFVFERSGRPDIALRYYDEALAYGTIPSLARPIAALRESSSYWTPRLENFLRKYPHARPPTASDGEEAAPPASQDFADLLIIVSYGRVPAKVAKRIPIGLALTYATANLTGPNQNTANRLAAQGLVTWVNYPELEEKQRRLSRPHVRVDDRALPLDRIAALDVATRNAYDDARGAIVASAITRTISRVVAGEAAGAAGRGATNDNVFGALISLATQATLTATDTPDTRSWVTLPARIDITRVRLPPGKHRIELWAQGTSKTVEVDLAPGGWQAVALTVLR